MTVSAVYFRKRGVFKGGYRRSDAGADGARAVMGGRWPHLCVQSDWLGNPSPFRLTWYQARATDTMRIHLQTIPAVILFAVSVRHLTWCLQSWKPQEVLINWKKKKPTTEKWSLML